MKDAIPRLAQLCEGSNNSKSDHDKLQLLQRIKAADRLERASPRPMEK